MKRTLLNLLKGISILFLTSCATIVHGTRQPIEIVSNPIKASVWVDHCYIGQTPLIANMTRRDNHLVKIELEGYLPYETMVSRQISGWVFGNIIFGGVLGIAIDAVSGGIYRLTPEDVHAELQIEALAHTARQEPHIFVVLKPNPSWEKIGNLKPKLASR